MKSISATALARNTGTILDDVVRERKRIRITRGKNVVASIVPDKETVTVSQIFDEYAAPLLTKKQAKDWLRDSRFSFDDRLRDRWER